MISHDTWHSLTSDCLIHYAALALVVSAANLLPASGSCGGCQLWWSGLAGSSGMPPPSGRPRGTVYLSRGVGNQHSRGASAGPRAYRVNMSVTL